MKVAQIEFPEYTGLRCLMMPFIQGDPDSVPDEYRSQYGDILSSVFINRGDIGFLTIDESIVSAGTPHRGARAKFQRPLHTEAGMTPSKIYAWGRPNWGGLHDVTLDPDVTVLLANSVSGSCALWDAEHGVTSIDGDIGDCADMYPYENATLMNAGDVHHIGILTPHESLPIVGGGERQFLRIVSSGVHGRERYFTENPAVTLENEE